jgi:acetyl esterase/lipase
MVSSTATANLGQQARQSASKLNLKADSVSIGGLSAGGHMTAVMSHIAKAEDVDLKLALMVVPSTDLRYVKPLLTKAYKN